MLIWRINEVYWQNDSFSHSVYFKGSCTWMYMMHSTKLSQFTQYFISLHHHGVLVWLESTFLQTKFRVEYSKIKFEPLFKQINLFKFNFYVAQISLFIRILMYSTRCVCVINIWNRDL